MNLIKFLLIAILFVVVFIAILIGTTGCTPQTHPDEFSLHYFHSWGDWDGSGVLDNDPERASPLGLSGDNDSDTLGFTVTWYLDQPRTPMTGGHSHHTR